MNVLIKIKEQKNQKQKGKNYIHQIKNKRNFERFSKQDNKLMTSKAILLLLSMHTKFQNIWHDHPFIN